MPGSSENDLALISGGNDLKEIYSVTICRPSTQDGRKFSIKEAR